MVDQLGNELISSNLTLYSGELNNGSPFTAGSITVHPSQYVYGKLTATIKDTTSVSTTTGIIMQITASGKDNSGNSINIPVSIQSGGSTKASGNNSVTWAWYPVPTNAGDTHSLDALLVVGPIPQDAVSINIEFIVTKSVTTEPY